MCQMLGKSFPGLQMEGILAAIALLKANGTEKLTLIGRGYGAWLASYTALLAEDVVKETILLDAPESFGELAGTYTERSFAGMVPEILKYTDFPEIARAVGARYE